MSWSGALTCAVRLDRRVAGGTGVDRVGGARQRVHGQVVVGQQVDRNHVGNKHRERRVGVVPPHQAVDQEVLRVDEPDAALGNWQRAVDRPVDVVGCESVRELTPASALVRVADVFVVLSSPIEGERLPRGGRCRLHRPVVDETPMSQRWIGSLSSGSPMPWMALWLKFTVVGSIGPAGPVVGEDVVQQLRLRPVRRAVSARAGLQQRRVATRRQTSRVRRLDRAGSAKCSVGGSGRRRDVLHDGVVHERHVRSVVECNAATFVSGEVVGDDVVLDQASGSCRPSGSGCHHRRRSTGWRSACCRRS